jgi:hypothetical protein
MLHQGLGHKGEAIKQSQCGEKNGLDLRVGISKEENSRTQPFCLGAVLLLFGLIQNEAKRSGTSHWRARNAAVTS